MKYKLWFSVMSRISYQHTKASRGRRINLSLGRTRLVTFFQAKTSTFASAAMIRTGALWPRQSTPRCKMQNDPGTVFRMCCCCYKDICYYNTARLIYAHSCATCIRISPIFSAYIYIYYILVCHVYTYIAMAICIHTCTVHVYVL